jgi:predicted MFS family arabinose efflux permease
MRFLAATSLRAQLPYLGDLAITFGQPPESASWLAAMTGFAGLASPFIGLIAYRIGQRPLILASVAIFVICTLLVPFMPTLVAVGVLFLGFAVAKIILDTQVLAFIGNRVPFEKRGSAMGVSELAWSLAWVIGVPTFGILLSRVTWWSPFVLIGFLAIIGFIALNRWVLPYVAGGSTVIVPLYQNAGLVLGNRRAIYMLIFCICVAGSTQMPYLVYPTWFKTNFQLNIEQLGFASIVIGIADGLAELSAALFTDRIGKMRIVLGAMGVYAVAFLILWLSSDSLIAMLAALFLLYFSFELGLVASLSVATEILPHARTVMAGFVSSAFAVGRIFGSLIALPLFGDGRLWLVAISGSLIVIVAIISVSAVFKAKLAQV